MKLIDTNLDNNEFEKLKKSKEVSNTGFGVHGKYHLVYFIFIYILQKYKINDIKILNCTYACNYLQNNHDNLKKLFINVIDDKEFEKIKSENKMIKFTGGNRRFIKTLKIKKQSLIYKIINIF